MASIPLISAEDVRQPGSENQEYPGAPVLLGESLAVRRLRSQIRRIAPYFRTALIHGETGAGKEQVARCLHAGSPAAGGPFVAAEASAVAEPFAHGEGPRPVGMGSVEQLLESALSGTIYLDGVDRLSPGLQAGLLRFLFVCGERRCGTSGARQERTDARARIVTASAQDLRRLTAVGQFKHDLYAHLSAVEIFVPPLRERTEDIPVLAEWLLRRPAVETRQSSGVLTDSAVSRLQKARWPGNLRQLEQVVCQAAALAEGAMIEPCHLLALAESEFAGGTDPQAKPERLDDIIQQHVFEVLGRCGGNKLRAAARLGISRSTLYRMLEAGEIHGAG